MGLTMPTLASGLLRGLASYQQGKTQGEDRRMEIERHRRLEERQAQRDAMQAELQRASMESMQAARARQQEQDRIAGEDRAREDSEGGYRSQGQTQQLGEALGPAQGGMMGAGPLGAALPSIGRLSGDLLAASKGPAAFTRNGVGMVKAGESAQERQDRLRAQERQGERMQSNEDALARDRQNNEQAAERDRAQWAFQSVENAKNRAAALEAARMRTTATATTMPKLTDGQRRVSGLVEIADAERKRLEAMGTPGWKDLALAKVPFGLGEGLMSDKGQEYMAATEAFARPYNYAVSGQAAPDNEVRSTMRQLIPGPFTRASADSALTERRRRFVGGMKTIAGQPGDAQRDESPQAAKFRADARAEGYSDEEIDAELRRMGVIR